MPPVILAHGALGIFDELIFIAVALIFISMMAYAWWRSRSAPLDNDTAAQSEAQPEDSPDSTQDTDRFHLE
ncbi:MAG: hypothetical protein IAE89_00915 [Anaerolineae bacterium]|nr:hypothetical protein [Anaerolineae bacterium]